MKLNLISYIFFIEMIAFGTRAAPPLLQNQALRNQALTNQSESSLKFKKASLKIKKKIIKVEVAETPEQHAYGLMNRVKLPENFGMLFVFTSEEPRFFWMKNTFVDLSIAYINKNKKIIDIQDMKAAESSLDENLPSYPSKGPAMYALEVNKGWFERHHIKVGDFISEINYFK